MKLIKKMEIEPAWDKRNPDPSKNYGINCAMLKMSITGDKGALEFQMFTGFHLPHNEKELLERCKIKSSLIKLYFTPNARHLVFHYREPGAGHMSESIDSCSFLGGAPCYGDYSDEYAEILTKTLIEEGSEKVWKIMETIYEVGFEEKAKIDCCF